jgi:Flp pilus assembly protein TadB
VVNSNSSPTPAPSLETLPTGELVRQILAETKELVRIEAKLARQEVRDDLLQLKHAAILLTGAAVLAIVVISTLVVALVLALGGTAVMALLAALVLAAAALVMALVAFKLLPREPLQRTRARLKSEVTQLKEHII